MRRYTIMFGAALIAAPLPAIAQVAPVAEPGSITTARAIVSKLRIERTMDPMFQQIMPLMTANVENAMATAPKTPEFLKAKLKTEEGRKQIGDIISEEFTAAFREHYPDIAEGAAEEYRKLFSEAELKAILAFYSSPAGAKLIEALPQLQQVLSEQGRAVGRQAGMTAFPKIQARLAALGAPATK